MKLLAASISEISGFLNDSVFVEESTLSSYRSLLASLATIEHSLGPITSLAKSRVSIIIGPQPAYTSHVGVRSNLISVADHSCRYCRNLNGHSGFSRSILPYRLF
ncbi:MAG: hypothetical protein IPO04_10980 [Cytophagaceae bacterium]|nr:hypothetical protein [Cytophagaceae bacterium]